MKSRKNADEADAIIVANKAAKSQSASPATPVEEKSTSGLSTTQWLTVDSIVVSLIEIYYKREHIRAAFGRKTPTKSQSSKFAFCACACQSVRNGSRFSAENRHFRTTPGKKRLPAHGLILAAQNKQALSRRPRKSMRITAHGYAKA